MAITGATGSLYALELLKQFKTLDVEVHGIISAAGLQVLELELGITRDDLDPYVHQWHNISNFAAPVASGSSRFDAMIILPCTMGTLASIAAGVSANLIHRAADVFLKERRMLILAVRETPLNRTHLLNMIRAQEAGAVICPPMPSFYHKPDSINDMAAQFAGRVAEIAGFEVSNLKRWTGVK